MVCYGQDAYLFAGNNVNERIRKTPHAVTALFFSPERTQPGMLQEQTYGVFELGEQRLRKRAVGVIPVEFGRFPKVALRFGMQRILHRNSAFSLARVSGPERIVTAPLSISA